MCAKELKIPKIFRSQRTTAITTTAFRIDLMVPCMGIRSTSHSSTPTTIRTIIIVNSGIGCCPPCREVLPTFLDVRIRSMPAVGHTWKRVELLRELRYAAQRSDRRTPNSAAPLAFFGFLELG